MSPNLNFNCAVRRKSAGAAFCAPLHLHCWALFKYSLRLNEYPLYVYQENGYMHTLVHELVAA